MPLDSSVDKIRVRGRSQLSTGTAGPPPSFFPTVARLVNEVSHSRIEMLPVGPYDNQTTSPGATDPATYNPTTGDWWADLIAVDDADVLASGQTQWGQWGVDDRGQRYYIEPKLGSPTFYGNATTGAPLAQGSGGIRTVWLDDLAALQPPTSVIGVPVTPSGGLDVESVQDSIAAMFTGGTNAGVAYSYRDDAGLMDTTVTVTGDLPESSAGLRSAPAGTPTDLLGVINEYTGTVAQPMPAAAPGRVLAVRQRTTGLTLQRAGSDVFVIGDGTSQTTLSPSLPGELIALHCTTAGQWRVTGSHKPQVALDARNDSRYTTTRVTSADQASAYTIGGAWPTGTDTVQNSRFRKRTATAGKNLVLEYLTVAAAGEAPPLGDGSAHTIRAAIEYPTGVFHPAYSREGNRDIVVTPGGGVGRLYVPGFDVPANTDWWVRTRVLVASTGGLIATAACNGSDEWNARGTGAADFTTTTTSQPSAGTSTGYGPSVVLYTPDTPLTVRVGLPGDSITHGRGDPIANASASTSAGGWAIRALSADGITGRTSPGIPNVNMSMPGELLANWADQTKRRSRMQVLDDANCNNFLVLLGTNDITGTLSAIQANLITMWRACARRGRVFGFTLPPRTGGSTDNWATLANQTAHYTNPTRVSLNQWLRAGAPISAGAAVAVGTSGALVAGNVGHPLYSVTDICAAVESSQDSGFWKVNGTANAFAFDDIHPSAGGHQAMAAVAYAQVIPNLLAS